ncbi:hypothetical protein XELAEV_18030162mg [Xenopus laevis]|uniref:GIY-YIG domain-containing protein n=1 Tax=Xenopus laevis TaxID=8355 RepID=A0A974HIQ8_XENLA|nr:hypothetical protein XELAEV_18030162mg [Xenopus laevis]
MGKTKKGTFPFLNCICCSLIMKGNTVNHPTKGTPIKLKDVSTCDTKYVVYVLKCPCGMACIGQTIRSVKVLIKEHRNNIRNFKTDTATDTPVSRHFYNQGHHLSQLRWLVLEKIIHPKRGGDMKNNAWTTRGILDSKNECNGPVGLTIEAYISFCN